jgi:hypothetical protein
MNIPCNCETTDEAMMPTRGPVFSGSRNKPAAVNNDVAECFENPASLFLHFLQMKTVVLNNGSQNKIVHTQKIKFPVSRDRGIIDNS